MRIASVMHKNPINSLNRLFPVGVSKRKKNLSALWGRLSVAAGLTTGHSCTAGGSFLIFTVFWNFLMLVFQNSISLNTQPSPQC